MSYKGFGTTRPIYPIPEKNEIEANENRRVEIMIVEN
jgi:flagellar motor protein MotB